MSRKAQNSFLVLTTLGVYLGLLMVGGAAPQVLAHSATTRTFEITDEIEVKDDLDNKPDIEEIKKFLESNYEQAVSDFVKDAVREQLGFDRSLSYYTENYLCSEGQSDRRGSKVAADDFPAFAVLLNRLDLASAWKFSDVPSFITAPETITTPKGALGFCKSFGTEVGQTPTEFFIKLKFSRKDSLDAFHVVCGLNEYFSDRDDVPTDPLTKVILERTRSTSNYSDVLVVTRLPRAGLDALLAKDAK